MNPALVWPVIIVVAVVCIGLRAAGPMMVSDGALPPRAAALIDAMAPALLAGLIVVGIVGEHGRGGGATGRVETGLAGTGLAGTGLDETGLDEPGLDWAVLDWTVLPGLALAAGLRWFRVPDLVCVLAAVAVTVVMRAVR